MSKRRTRGRSLNQCTRCGSLLVSRSTVWLELSLTDGNYYKVIPSGHVSQGLFAFGKDCASIEITKQ